MKSLIRKIILFFVEIDFKYLKTVNESQANILINQESKIRELQEELKFLKKNVFVGIDLDVSPQFDRRSKLYANVCIGIKVKGRKEYDFVNFYEINPKDFKELKDYLFKLERYFKENQIYIDKPLNFF